MKASDFTRDDCRVGKHRRTYDTLTSEWRCGDCGALLVMLGSRDDERFPKNWYVGCVACGALDFIHERQLQRQKADAIEVLSGLPPEMQDLLQPDRAQLPERPPGIFSLSAIEPEDF